MYDDNYRNISIMRDREFTASNRMFDGVVKTMRLKGFDHTKHKSDITDGDMKKLYQSDVFNLDEPIGLIHKVYFDISLHFVRRGREGLRKLTKHSFDFNIDSDGVEFVTMAFNEAEKTKQGTEKVINEKEGCMYAQLSDPMCLVKSLKRLIARFHSKRYTVKFVGYPPMD